MNPDNRVWWAGGETHDDAPTGVWALTDYEGIVAVYDNELYALRALNAQMGTSVEWLPFGATLSDARAAERAREQEVARAVPVPTDLPETADEADPELGNREEDYRG